MKDAAADQPPVEVRRCRDPQLAARILRRDYFDDPMPLLPDGVVRTLARDWVAARDDVYLMLAEVGGRYAGFVFAHTLGPYFWRLFGRAHPAHLPALLWAMGRMRLGSGRATHVEGDAPPLAPEEIEAQLAALDVTSLPRPFEWPAAGSGGGIIPLLYVSPDARGAGVAPRLLAGLNEEMFASGAASVEAHIDVENLPSARAFRKAGFELFLMSTGDLWARKKADR